MSCLEDMSSLCTIKYVGRIGKTAEIMYTASAVTIPRGRIHAEIDLWPEDLQDGIKHPRIRPPFQAL